MLNFALIGCGRIAKRHSELLGSGLIKNAKLVSVCDIIEDRARDIAEKYNCSYYTDMRKMLENEKIDIVNILTPSGMHKGHSIIAMNYGKHVVVEKPMALTLEDADEMIENAKRNKIKLFVVKQNRFNLPVKKLREQIEKKRFGKIVLGTIRVRWKRTQEYYDNDSWRGTWALDGGVLANQASHHIDLLQWMVGDVESVFAKSSTALVKIETEDTAIATLKFKNGALGLIEATTATRPRDIEGSISILGERGIVEIGGFAVNKIKIWDFIDNNDDDKFILENYSTNPPDVYGFGHREYLQDVVNHIKEKNATIIDGEEGRKSLELICALYHSIEKNKEVFLNKKSFKSRLGQK